MQFISFQLVDLHKHGPAFYSYLMLRKRYFVDRLGCDTPHDDEVEMDSFDNPLTWYTLAVQNGTVVAGVRLVRPAFGSPAVNLFDTQDGSVLEKIDNSDPDVWNCTRIAVRDDAIVFEERRNCLSQLIEKATTLAKSQGATDVHELGKYAFEQYGLGSCKPAVPILRHVSISEEDRSLFAVSLRDGITSNSASLYMLRFFFVPDELDDRIEALESMFEYDSNGFGHSWAKVYLWWTVLRMCLQQIWACTPLAKMISAWIGSR